MNRQHFLAASALLCTALLTPLALAQPGNPVIRMVTNVGTIEAELHADKAPKTVANFVQYVRDKHYDGLIFHRVIGQFMIQGGGYDSQYRQRPTRAPVEHEGRQAAAAGLKNEPGTLAMARTNDPHSATSQFFINVVPNAFLDPTPAQPGYTVFGKVTAGMDVVEKIRNTPTGAGGPFPTDVPRTPVIIQSITLVK
ncbi:MAG: peptidylprolyl isomerase [Limnohabitans sp.]|jgi:cyclophilin family peptidyl-prolyl cis-trans isomerase